MSDLINKIEIVANKKLPIKANGKQVSQLTLKFKDNKKMKMPDIERLTNMYQHKYPNILMQVSVQFPVGWRSGRFFNTNDNSNIPYLDDSEPEDLKFEYDNIGAISFYVIKE